MSNKLRISRRAGLKAIGAAGAAALLAGKPLNAFAITAGKRYGRMEEMLPDEIETVLATTPIAFVPLGTFEHHGWHLPVCFDGIKAHAICERVAEKTGGVVLPTFYYGTGGGHANYKFSIILPEEQIRPILETTLDHLAKDGFKVVVVLTGHYPQEQIQMAHRLAKDAHARNPQTRFIGLTEPEVTTPLSGQGFAGDHAATYETSIAMALNMPWVKMSNLTEGRDPSKVTRPETPKSEDGPQNARHPLYAIYGQDPRTGASKKVGQKLVDEIVSRLAKQVDDALIG